MPYGRYNLMETMPLAMMKHLEEDVPPVFMILDTYDKDVKVNINFSTPINLILLLFFMFLLLVDGIFCF